MSQDSTHNRTVPERGSAARTWTLVLLGLVFIVGGSLAKGQPWTTPEMFKDLGLDLAKTVSNIGFFLIFIQVINGYFYKPLAESMNERDSELEHTFTEAETLKSQMDSMKAEYEKRLVEAEAAAREQIQQQIREAQAVRTQLMAEASQKADELLQRAREEIEHEKHKLISDLQLHMVNMSLAAAEKVVGMNLDNDQNRKLVEEFIEKAEANN